jgi:ABC-2 type transport system permease protein
MKILKITWKSILEHIRDFRTLLMIVIFSISFIIIFGILFGSSYYTFRVFILNKDKGVPSVETDSKGKEDVRKYYSLELIALINEARYEDGKKIFKVKEIMKKKDARKKLEKQQYAALFIIPPDFSEKLFNSFRIDNKLTSIKQGSSKIEVIGDPGYPSFSIVKLIFDAFLEEYIKFRTGLSPPIKTSVQMLSEEKKSGSEFNYLAPGLILMSIYLFLIQVAMVIIQEVENGTIIRLKMSNVKTWELLAGISGSQIIFSIILVPLMLYTAILVGFQTDGSLLLGIFFGIIAAMSSVAIALIVAAFSKTIPIIFLSGIFFPVPDIRLFSLFKHSFTIFDLMPTTHAHRAFLQIFLYDAKFPDLTYELSMLIFITALYFIIGTILFKKFHLKN